jgi:hypothetical protein
LLQVRLALAQPELGLAQPELGLVSGLLERERELVPVLGLMHQLNRQAHK